MVRGLQSEGVAATAKHFPGKGDAVVDPHYELPVLDHDDDRLEEVELVPFRAAVDAGAHLLMVGHYSVPVLTGDRVTPISASPALRDVVRLRVGFGGVVISDALDMGAFTASGTNASLVAAGVDALLCMTDRGRATAACLDIAGSDPTDHAAATRRLAALRRRMVARKEPGLDRLRSARAPGDRRRGRRPLADAGARREDAPALP